MASYGGVTIYVIAENSNGQIVYKDWDQHDDSAVARTKIPYADAEYTQYVGRGNDTLTLKVDIYSDADYNTLRGFRGDMIPRTLVDPFGLGIDYQNVLLQRVYDAERVTYQEEWHVTLMFERVKSL
jgi:hypothetical protein